MLLVCFSFSFSGCTARYGISMKPGDQGQPGPSTKAAPLGSRGRPSLAEVRRDRGGGARGGQGGDPQRGERREGPKRCR